MLCMHTPHTVHTAHMNELEKARVTICRNGQSTAVSALHLQRKATGHRNAPNQRNEKEIKNETVVN